MGIGVGVVMGFLQAVWATTSVVSPLAAGALTGVAGPSAVFALTLVGCLGVLGVTAAWIWRQPLQAWLRAARHGINAAA
jgi:hypothetical protein